MIGSFKDKEANKILAREPSRRYASLQRVIHRKLLQVQASTDLEALRSPPSNRLEALRGDRKGQFSIRVNDQYRICFAWRDGYAYDIEITDYH